MIDERKEEAAALYVLDLLEGAERSAFEADLAADRELGRLVAQLRETSAGVALLAPSAAPSPLLRERILVSAAARSTTTPDHIVPFFLPSWTAWAAAACFALAAGYFAITNFNTRSQFGALRESERLARIDSQNVRNLLDAERIISRRQIDALKLAQNDIALLRSTLVSEHNSATDQIAALTQQSSLADLTITALTGLTPEARASAVWNSKTQEGMLSVSKLPALAQDKDYQLWIVDPQYPAPVDGGVFQVDPTTGAARIAFKPAKAIKSAAKFAVSLERKGGVPKAEGPMVLLSD